jgi:archaellum component FlaG (FlaF/FlaG flagellin family)
VNLRHVHTTRVVLFVATLVVTASVAFGLLRS